MISIFDKAGWWPGIESFCGSLSGIPALMLAGLILQRTGQFFGPFPAASIVTVVGPACCTFVVDPLEP
ncbi:MAG: hypothetical protein ACREJM_01435, partial [Candidatus Saccharimonadales bacterium]